MRRIARVGWGGATGLQINTSKGTVNIVLASILIDTEGRVGAVESGARGTCSESGGGSWVSRRDASARISGASLADLQTFTGIRGVFSAVSFKSSGSCMNREVSTCQ